MKKLMRYISGFVLILILGTILGFTLSNINDTHSSVADSGMSNLPQKLLLKDWQPKSIYKVPETKIERARFPVIDMHAHNYTSTSEDVAKREQVLNHVNVDKSVVFAGVTGERFDAIYKRYSEYSKFYVFCGLDFSGYKKEGWSKKAVQELRRCVKNGALGVGEIVDKGRGLNSSGITAEGLHSDDSKMDPIWEECAKLDIPVNLHISDPMWMYEPMDSTNDGFMRSWTWRIGEKTRENSHKDMMQILTNTFKRHPNTTFVIAHLGNCTYDLSILGKMFDEFPNFYTDISARFSEFSSIPRYTKKFMTKYQDRLVYGTDYGFEVWKSNSPYGQREPSLQEMYKMTFRVLETQDEHFYMTNLLGYKWPLYGLGLDNQVLKKIYHTNALKIMGR